MSRESSREWVTMEQLEKIKQSEMGLGADMLDDHLDHLVGNELDYAMRETKSQKQQKVMSQFVLKQPSKPVKIESVTGDGTYTNKANALQYKYVYLFSDGVIMSASYDENNCPFKQGDEVIYTVNWSSAKGNLGSVKSATETKKPYSGKTGSGWKPKSVAELKNEQLVRNPSMALSYAKDYITATGFDPSEGRPHEAITDMADHLLAWLNERTHQVNEQ